MDELTPRQAYLAMYHFLEGCYRRTKADDVGTLLGSTSLLPDGMPADPAIEADWLAAVQAARSGAVSASMELTK